MACIALDKRRIICFSDVLNKTHVSDTSNECDIKSLWWKQITYPERLLRSTHFTEVCGDNFLSYLFTVTWVAPCENSSSGICGQRRPDQPAHPLETIECFNGEQMP